MNTQGVPVEISFTVDGTPRTIILEAGAVFDATFYGADNVVVNGKPLFESSMKDLGSIVKQAAFLDVETSGKVGGSVITEASLYNAEKNVVDVFFMKPYHMVNMNIDDMEAASMSSKLDRGVVNIRARVTPKTHAASFFTKHLSAILRDKTLREDFLLNTTEAGGVFKSDAKSDPLAKFLRSKLFKGVSAEGVNKLVLEEALLKADRVNNLYDNPVIRNYLLKYTAEVDPFQTRYYVENLEEVERLGIRRHLFGTVEDQQIHSLMSYVRDPSRVDSPAELLKRAEEMETIFQERYASDVKVRAHYTTPDEMVERMLPLMEGKSIHASQALFESKQFGAMLRGRIAQELLAEDPDIIKSTPREFNAAIERRLIEQGNPFEKVVAGVSYTGDPFYTTGDEYNLARAKALKENSFVNLLPEYLRSTGPREVRDVIDLQKIMQGSIHRLGIQDIPKPQAMSVEVQARLFGAAKAIEQGQDASVVKKLLLEKEAHASAFDAAVSSPKIMSAALEYAVAGEELYKKTDLGKHYYDEALKGRGPLMGLFAYGELSNFYSKTLAPDDLGLMDILFEQRVARNLESVLDLENVGTFKNVEGYKYIQVPTYSLDDSGTRVQNARTVAYARTKTYKGMSGIYASSRVIADDYAGTQAENVIQRLIQKVDPDKEVFEFDELTKEYKMRELPEAATPQQASTYNASMGRLRSRVAKMTESNEGQIKLFQRRIQQKGQALDNIISGIQDKIKRHKGLEARERTTFNVSSRSSLERAFGNHSALQIAKKVFLPVAGFGMAMSGLSTLEKFQQPERSSYLIPSYNDWFKSQAQMFGSSESFVRAMREKTGYIEGMQEEGMAAKLRKLTTDFGSPYTGPGYSDQTLQYNELLRERQRKLRYAYTARHLEYTGDIRNMIGRFISNTFKPPEQAPERNMRSILSSTSLGATPYKSLRGQNLTKVSVSGNYKINVEDADTITLQRNLGSGGMKDFFFGRKNNQSMSIRLAGIDAPETAHQNRGAQPYAEAAKRIAVDMINRAKNVEVVFDDSDSTYGRRVGVVYADGVNVNLELIKRGAAAYLPYRSNKKRPIYDTQEFEAAEQTAYKSKRGMWRTDYFRSYKQIAQASGQTVTFNTLVNPSKVANSSSLMTMYSAMKTAENFGMYHTESQMALADATLSLSERAKSSRQNIFKPDFNQNEWRDASLAVTQPTNSILTGMYELQSDLQGLINTKGGSQANKHSALNLKTNDFKLSEELASPKYNAFNKNYNKHYADRNRKLTRLATMQALQQRENHRIFNYRSGHHRM